MSVEQQGRECDAYECTRLGTVLGWYHDGDGGEECLYCEHHAEEVGSTGEFSRHTPSSAPPARDSGRDEAREAIVRWLVAFDPHNEAAMYEQDWVTYRRQADELLALPAVASLLRDGGSGERTTRP